MLVKQYVSYLPIVRQLLGNLYAGMHMYIAIGQMVSTGSWETFNVTEMLRDLGLDFR